MTLCNVGSRIPRGNVFPLFVFLVIVLVILLVTQLYFLLPLLFSHSAPVFRLLFSLRCLPYLCSSLLPSSPPLPFPSLVRFQYTPLYYVYRGVAQLSHCWNHHKKNAATGKISGFDILRRGDPLRAEMAPFTGDYYQYLMSEFDKKKCFSSCSSICRKIIRYSPPHNSPTVRCSCCG
jgi:hypothetical protein